MSDIDDFKLVPPPSNPKPSVRTPMMQQYMEAKAKEPDALLFFRMGDFYEMFYEDAVEAANILEIALTTRDKKSDNPIPMCGVPYHALDNYVGKLIKKGYRIAICEQVEDPKQAKGLVRREITRVITPGTLMEENLLESRENNFLCALAVASSSVGLAFVDVSTGEFIVTGFDGENKWQQAADEITLRRPKEIIHPYDLEIPDYLKDELQGILKHGQEEWWFGVDYCSEELMRHFNVASLNAFELNLPGMIAAAGGALKYLKETQRAELEFINDLRVIHTKECMLLDEVSRRNLELVESWMTGDKKDSLIGLMDKTVTSMGARLIRKWLLQPLLDIDKINQRLDAVAELIENPIIQQQLVENLKSIADLERLMTRVSLGSANARDIVSIRNSMEKLPSLLSHLEGMNSQRLQAITTAIDPLNDLVKDISTTLVDEPPLTLKDGKLIVDGKDDELDELRAIVKDNKSFIADIERRERGKTGISNLRVRYNKVFGYYIEVSKGNLDLVPDDYFRKQTLVNAERFITPELKEFESKVINAQDRIVVIEYELFNELRDRVSKQRERVLTTAKAIAQLDVLRCFAEISSLYNYCRPKVSSNDIIEIKRGRHPVVERLRIDEPFIPNDALLDTQENRLLIITGPNMGGKSTFLRQIALTCIMAQMGCYVPAQSASLSIVDRIFTRIGASDYLAKGHSTFMVEMSETANILRNATRKSLIILDEVGRGTSTFDGLSIAWAVAEYIHNTSSISAKTLFATHYHELTELELTLDGVKNYNVAAKEVEDDVIFLRSVVSGPSDQSYGIQVAKLAGMPDAVVSRARQILANLEKNELDREGKPRMAAEKNTNSTSKSPSTSAVENILKDVNIDEITPVQAFRILNEIIQNMKKIDNK